MFRFIRLIPLTMSLVAAAAEAQTVTQSASVVRGPTVMHSAPIAGRCNVNSPTPPSFARCALALERTELRQGYLGEVVDRPFIIRPISLTSFVSGDSAMHYARLYERNSRSARELEHLGGGLFMLSVMAAAGCHAVVCGSMSHHRTIMAARYTGYAVIAMAIPFQIHGRHQGYKAVDLYNATLAHAR